jgi:hypothetical protein
MVMKKWNTPELETLDVAKTANGIFANDFESVILFKDSKSNTPTVTPSENDDVVDALS